MSVIIYQEKCTGCGGQSDPPCVNYCPGDLLAIDEVSGKPYIYNQRDCWDCMVCVKACPKEAIETRLPYQLAGYRASLKPRVFKEKIVWHLQDNQGKEEIYELETGG